MIQYAAAISMTQTTMSIASSFFMAVILPARNMLASLTPALGPLPRERGDEETREGGIMVTGYLPKPTDSCQ